MKPNRIHDKVELNKDSTERENTAHQNRGDRSQVEGLIRNLSRNLVCTNRLLNTWFTETDVGSKQTERERDDEPKCNHGEHGSKWYSTRGIGIDQEKVET